MSSNSVYDSGGRIEDDDIYKRRAELVLVSPSNSYLRLNSIFVSVNGLSSSLVSYYLLTIYFY